MAVLLSTAIVALLIVIFIYPAWPTRGLLLGCLLRVNGHIALGGAGHGEDEYPRSMARGIWGRVRWHIWQFDSAELDCLLTVKDLIDPNARPFQVPQPGNQSRVVAGTFYWPVVRREEGDASITFSLPPGFVSQSGIGVDGMYRPLNAQYLMQLQLSWKGVRVYKQHFMVRSWGTHIGDGHFLDVEQTIAQL